MSDRPPAVELRRSVALLVTEWWLAVGAVAGYLAYGVWVVATGLALDALGPTLASTTVGPVSGLVVLAAVVWVLVPAVAAASLLDRQLSNVNGNLVSQYRIDHPGVLPAPSGVVVLLAGAAALVVGPRPPVLVVMAVAGVHLLVRTIAFGRRVYSFSPPLLFRAFSFVSALALAAAWLVHAPGLPGSVGERVASAGVVPVVETGLAAAGVAPGTALGLLVAVPALLSGAYLAVQALVARRVRSAAPLADPVKRAEQRYPIMPPVADSSRPGPPTGNGSASASTASSTSSGTDSTDEQPTDDDTATADSTETTDDATSTAETTADATATTDDSTETTDDSAGDDSSHTQVFTTDEPIPEDEDAMAAVAGDVQEEEDEAEEDGWIDDTAIFSPDGATSSDDECGSCGESIPRESVTFCPNCGERI